MPMYYPDLKSVQVCVKTMQMHKDNKKYKGIYPKTEKDLPEARIQLGKYFREVWKDNIAAVEVELALDHNNYEQKMQENISKLLYF